MSSWTIKKQGIGKVLGSNSYTIMNVINRLPKAPFKELLLVRNFCGKK